MPIHGRIFGMKIIQNVVFNHTSNFGEEGLNELNIGPQGLTGTGSVMAVHVEHAARHPSCLAVGISTGCWAHRRATIRFSSDLSYEVLTHKGAKL